MDYSIESFVEEINVNMGIGLTPLIELANDARFAVEDLIDDDRWGWFVSLPDAEQIQWRYCHADCDDFALTVSEITGWEVIAINNPSRGPVHRLALAPDGRLLDAKGWVTLEDLRQRYKLKRLDVQHDSPWFSPLISCDEHYYPVLNAILQLPVAPFTDIEFQNKAIAFCRTKGLVLEPHR